MKKHISLIWSILLSTSVMADPDDYDINFGGLGVTTLNLSLDTSESETAWDVGQASDGKYYVAGDLRIASGDQYFVLTRFNSDGSLD